MTPTNDTDAADARRAVIAQRAERANRRAESEARHVSANGRDLAVGQTVATMGGGKSGTVTRLSHRASDDTAMVTFTSDAGRPSTYKAASVIVTADVPAPTVRPADTVAVREGMTVRFREDSPQFAENGGDWIVIERDPVGDEDGAQRAGHGPARGFVVILRAADVRKSRRRQRTRLAYVDNLTVVADVPDGFVPTRTPAAIAADGPHPDASTTQLITAFMGVLRDDDVELAIMYRDEIDRRGAAGDPHAAMWTATSMFRSRV